MAVPASGPISISDLKAAFPAINSNSLSAYRGTKWYRSNNSRGNFGNPTISMSESYDTRPTNPVTPGSATYYGTTNFTIPLFNTLSITCKGGNGGGAGVYGVDGCNGNTPTSSGSGGAGGTSYFGGYLSASGGAGGTGNGGGGSSGATTSRSLYITDNDQSLVSIQGSVITIGVGGGGGGGSGGENKFLYNFWCYTGSPQPSGSAGAAGYVSVSWS